MAKIIMLCGRLCSGKSTYSAQLKSRTGAVVLSVDELMIALLGRDTGEMHDEYVRRAEGYLYNKAAEIASAGTDVVLDQGFWTRESRAKARELFSSVGVPCELHYIHVTDAEWERRIARRNAEVAEGRSDAYFVDDGLKAKFISLFEAPDESEITVRIEG
jgi:predicted kinase